jgi:hypothetical protein
VIIDELNAGIEADTQDAFTLLDRKIGLAKIAVANDLYTSLALNQRVNTLLSDQVAGYFQDDMQGVAAEANKYKGIQLWNRQSGSSFLELQISEIGLQVNYTGDVDVKIYDLISATLLKTITIPTVAGEIVRVNTDFGYVSKKQWMNIYVCYETTGIPSYQTYILNSGCAACNRNASNQYMFMNAASIGTSQSMINSNLSGISNTAGLSITYSLNCAIEPFICSIKNLCAYPLAMKTLAEVMREMSNSNRFNSIISLNRGDNKELMAYYEAEYERAMKNIMMNMVLEDKVCFPCLPKVKIVTRVP